MNVQCFVEKPIFLVDNKLSLISRTITFKNKISGKSTAVESPLASSIRPKRQARQVHLISLYLYNDAATIYFSHHS